MHSECVACELAEYQQYCGSRAIPSQGNSLLEQQYLSDVVIALDVFKIRLLLRQPYGETMVIGINAFHHVKILHHLLHNLRVVGSHSVARVVRQLYEQQRIDVHSLLLICISYLLAFLQCLVYKMLVEGNVVGISACHVGIEQHSLLNHLLAYNLLSVDVHQLLRLSLGSG